MKTASRFDLTFLLFDPMVPASIVRPSLGENVNGETGLNGGRYRATKAVVRSSNG
jgi:hypothetical protein